MTVIGGFMTTWSNARKTYGEGAPQTGDQYDNSAALNQLETGLESAAPGSRWTGTAATSYGAANTEHRRVIGQLAGLDRKLAAEVSNSAQVIDAGRRNLDAVRQWVADAAASVPPGQAGETMRMAIAQKGLAQLQEIIRTSNAESNAISGRLSAIGAEFRALGEQKFAQGTGDDNLPETGDGNTDEEEEAKKRAEEDVRRTLEDGDQEAAGRVDEVLSGISPGHDLDPVQRAYLEQMASQQADMSVDDLKVAQDRLGEHKNVIGDSWQLMSNDDVRFGEPNENGIRPPGSFDRLPESVQKAISISNLDYPAGEVERRQIEDVADIVRNGDARFQTGTELDREMIRLSDRLMDQSPTNEATVRELFTSAGRDHQIIRDHLMGWQPHLDGPEGTVPYDYNPDDFLKDVMTTSWGDDGKAAGDLFSWTNEYSHGTEHERAIAAETAEKYAQFIGANKDDLMNIEHLFGTDTLGQVNPELVKGLAHGLTPYMDDIATLSGAEADGDRFDPLDQGNSERPNAKGVFAVLGTQQDAYVEFNSAADALGLEKAHQYGADVKNGVPVSTDDKRILDAAVLKGLVASGTAEGLHQIGLDDAEAYEWRKMAYNQGVAKLGALGGPIGAVGADVFGQMMESSVIGEKPNASGGIVPNMPEDESARFIVNALLASGVQMEGLEGVHVVDALDENGNPLGYKQVLSGAEMVDRGIVPPSDTDMQQSLNDALNTTLGNDNLNMSDEFADKYEQITKIPGGSGG